MLFSIRISLVALFLHLVSTQNTTLSQNHDNGESKKNFDPRSSPGENKEKVDISVPGNIGSKLSLTEQVLPSTPTAVDPNFIKQLNDVVVRFLHQITNIVKDSPEEAIKITEKNVAKILSGSLNESSTSNTRTRNFVQSRGLTENDIPSPNTGILEATIARKMEKKLPYLSQIAIQATSHQPKVIADYKIRHTVENELSEVISSTLLATQSTPTNEMNRTNNLVQTTTNYSTIATSKTSFNNQKRLNAEKNRSAHVPQFPFEESTTQTQSISATTTEIIRQNNRPNEQQKTATKPIHDSTIHIATKTPQTQLQEVVKEMNRITNFRQTATETTITHSQTTSKNFQTNELEKWSELEIIHNKMTTPNINKPIQRNFLDSSPNPAIKKHEQPKSRLLSRISEVKNDVFAEKVNKPEPQGTKPTTAMPSINKHLPLSELKANTNSPTNKQRSSTVRVLPKTIMQPRPTLSPVLNRKAQSRSQDNRIVNTIGNRVLPESTIQRNHATHTPLISQHRQAPSRSMMPRKPVTTSPQLLTHMRTVDKATFSRQQKQGIHVQHRNGNETVSHEMKSQNKAEKSPKQFLQKSKPNVQKKQQNISKDKEKKSGESVSLHFKFQRDSKQPLIESVKAKSVPLKHRETLQKFDQKHAATENIKTTQQNITNERRTKRPIKVPLNVTNPRRSPQKISAPPDRVIINGVLFKASDLPSEPTVTSLPLMIRSPSSVTEETTAIPSFRLQNHLRSSPREAVLNDMIFELFRRLHIDSFVMKTGDFSVKASANPKHTQFIPIETFDRIQQGTAPFLSSVPTVRTQRRLHEFEDDEVKVIVSGSQRKGNFREENGRILAGHAPSLKYQGHPRPSLASVRRVHTQRQAGRNPVFHRILQKNNQQEMLNELPPPTTEFGNWKENRKIDEFQQNELEEGVEKKVGIQDEPFQRNRRIANTVRNYRTAQKRLEAIKTY